MATIGNAVVRRDLQGYSPASNLAFNNEIKRRQAAGESIVHLAFGQSPFPVPQAMQDALRLHAPVHEYLPVTGRCNAVCRRGEQLLQV